MGPWLSGADDAHDPPGASFADRRGSFSATMTALGRTHLLQHPSDRTASDAMHLELDRPNRQRSPCRPAHRSEMDDVSDLGEEVVSPDAGWLAVLRFVDAGVAVGRTDLPAERCSASLESLPTGRMPKTERLGVTMVTGSKVSTGWRARTGVTVTPPIGYPAAG